MQHITDIKSVSPAIASGLKILRERIDAARIPSSRLDETFNLATWNIREFGKTPRTEAGIHYIAEILGRFDLIAVVELRDDLRDLARVMQVLGPYWGAVYSDATLDHGGNRERLGFVFDKRQIAFNGLASAAFAPRSREGTEWQPGFNWWRPPYLASFRSGNFDFVLLSTHIRWGDREQSREGEISELMNWVRAKVALLKDKRAWAEKDIFVVGDFNIPSRRSRLFKLIENAGMKIPGALLKADFGSNLDASKSYDQILHLPGYPDNFTNHGGVLDFYCGDHKPLFPGLSKERFTYQLSDHFPLWIQVNTDIDGFVLDQVIQGKRE